MGNFLETSATTATVSSFARCRCAFHLIPDSSRKHGAACHTVVVFPEVYMLAIPSCRSEHTCVSHSRCQERNLIPLPANWDFINSLIPRFSLSRKQTILPFLNTYARDTAFTIDIICQQNSTGILDTNFQLVIRIKLEESYCCHTLKTIVNYMM